jgi:hypothetical protein
MSEVEPEYWVVLRYRGGWNVDPEVVVLSTSRATALVAALFPEIARYDPPADLSDVFTFHPVLPCPVAIRHVREVAEI